MPSLPLGSSRAHLRPSSVIALVILSLLAPCARSAPIVGFVEHWSGTGLDGWGGGDVYSNPGAGGVLGASDGFLMFSTPGPSPTFIENLGAQTAGANFTGNWEAAGIKQVRFWLDDVGNADPLEMHFCIGDADGGNFWQYDTGFIPAHDRWTPFVVDLGSAAGFTHIIDSPPGGTFDAALQNVNRVLIRHDLAPYTQSPDRIVADVAVDEMLLTDGVTGVSPGPGAAPRPLVMAPPYPNPSRGPVALALEVFEDAPITLQVVDVTGRVVRHGTLAAGGVGPRLWTWDGRTDAGASAPAGVYRVRAFGPSGGASRSLVRIAGAR